MNVYGTKEYFQFNRAWTVDFDKAKKTTDVYDYDGYRVTADEYSVSDDQSIVRTYCVSVARGNKEIYRYSCNDYFMKPCFFTYGGRRHMFFKRELYGYSIVNLDDGQCFDYFPSDVLLPAGFQEGDQLPAERAGEIYEEAFIITGCLHLKDILLADGCYWAGPGEVWLIDLETKKTHFLSRDWRGAIVDTAKIKTTDDAVTIPFEPYENADETEKQDSEKTFGYRRLKELLEQSDTYDL